MIINKKIFNNFLDLKNINFNKIIDVLTNLGFSTEIIVDYEKSNTGLVVAKIITKKKDSKYNNFNICTVTDGTNEYPIICGDPNFEIGDLIILSKVGAVLKNTLKIGEKKICNYISKGMMCSYFDLGIYELNDIGIIILKKDAILGDEKPLKYISFDDAMIEIETLPTYPISKSIFGLSKFLSGKLNLNFKKIKKPIFINKKIIFNKINKENKMIQTIYFKNEMKQENIQWLNAFSKIINIENKNIFEKLLDYINILFGTDLRQYFCDEEPKIIEIKKEKIFINNKFFDKNKKKGKFIIVIADNLFNNKFWPTSQILNKAMNFFVSKINEIDCSLKIFTDFEKNNPRKEDKLNISLNEIIALLGFKITFLEIKEILERFDFKVEENSKNISFVCPTWNKYNYKQYVIEEIARFYECKKIPLKKFDLIPEFNIGDTYWKAKIKLENYLLSVGIDQVKTFSMIEKNNFIYESNIKIKQNKKDKNLRTTLINSLNNLNYKKHKNIFTIDKIFIKNNKNKIEEKNKLTILFNKNLYKNPIKNNELIIDKLFIINLLKNIFSLFNISSNNLWQKYSEKDKFFLDKKVEDTLFSNKGYEEIYWGDKFVSIIGEINLKEGTSFKHSHFLEIDLDILIDIYFKKSNLKFIEDIYKKEIYRDFTIDFGNFFSYKISVKIKSGEIFEFNNFNHWINLIKSIHLKINNVELICIYKKSILTFRIWISSDNLNQNNIFLEIEKELFLLKNKNNIK